MNALGCRQSEGCSWSRPVLPGNPEAAYEACLHWLKAGKQRETEQVLAEAVRTYKDDPRLLFFAAACERSRFAVREAAPIFARVVKADKEDGLYGRAARLILSLDGRREVGRNFAALRGLVEERPDDPLLLWMAGVQCRSLNRNPEGVEYYGRLLKQLDPGPVLVHQTYANLLDEVGRSADAMTHRELAVKLEPAGWSYQGMANTLTRLERWADADAAYAKATAMDPDRVQYWINWAWSMERRRDDAGVIEKCKRGTELDPRAAPLWTLWGDAERRLGRPEDAMARYDRALGITPKSANVMRRAVQVLRELGDNNRLAEMQKRLAEVSKPQMLPPASTGGAPKDGAGAGGAGSAD